MSSKTSSFFIAFFSLLAYSSAAQDLQAAKRLAEAGQHFEAEKLYNAVLAQTPDHLEALIGAAYNLSWAGRTDDAREKFEAVLAIDPNNASALVGKGYNLAWSGQYAAAKYPFLALQQLKPDDKEARKGLGYVYLWQGNGPVAIRYFEDLLLENPRDIEFYVALAQAYILENRIRKARIALRSALLIDSTNRVAGDLLKNTFGIAAPLEVDIWTGFSKTGGMGNFNLRTVQLTALVAPDLRMYLKYDNSLSLDIASLVRTNQEAQAFSIGGVKNWNKRFTSRLEYGPRLMPGGAVQQIFSTEQVYFLTKKLAIKGGGFLGISKQLDNEWLGYAGFRIPMTRFYALEPYYFYSRVENAPRPENRFLLNNQFRAPNGYEVNLGAMFGKAGIAAEAPNDAIAGVYTSALFPFSRQIWGQASLRWERSPYDDLLAFALGIKVRLER